MAATPRRRPVSAADVIRFIESYCVIPDGKYVGQPVKLVDFQVDFIRAVYDNPAGTRRAILSMGRKNSKSTLAAGLMLNHLAGPSARDRPNSQLYSTAQSLDQAAIVYTIARKMVMLNPKLASAIKIHESRKALSCPDLGVTYRALSADSHRALGLNPQFVIHDELGQVRGPRSALFDAMESGAVALEDPLTIVISTQSPNNDDLMSLLIDDASAGHDPHTVLRLYTCPADCADFYAEQAIRAANPAFDHFQNQRELIAEANKAQRLPSFSNSYKNLTLNMRVESGAAPFLAIDVWKACGAAPGDLAGCQVYAGLDLSTTTDLTALVLAGCDPLSGNWNVVPFFFLPEEGIHERAREDRAPYDLWVEQGHIELTPGATVSYEFLGQRLLRLVDDYDIKKIAFDRHNFAHLKPWLLKARFSEAAIAETFIEFGQGFKSMSPALRDVEGRVFERKLRHGNHPVLTMCVANSVVTMDPAGSRKLDKKRARGRIDGAVALVMALACAPASMTKTVDVAALIG
jgi:phage terminase large subunit-like protein